VQIERWLSFRGVAQVLLSLLVAMGLLMVSEALVAHNETAWTFDETRTGAFAVEDGPHPHLLWELPEGVQSIDGFRVTVNSLGLRGAEPTRPKPVRTRRVVAMGDGRTYGYGVSEGERFVDVAVAELGGSRVWLEAWALAVPGYSIVQLHNLLDLRGWTLEPDLLVVVGPGLEHTVDRWIDDDLIEPVHGHGGIREMLNPSALFRVLDHWFRVRWGDKATARHRLHDPDAGLDRLRRPRVDPNDYAHHLVQVVEEARTRSVEVVFLVLPVPADLSDEPLSARLMLARSVLHDVARSLGVLVVEGGDRLHATGRSVADLWLDERHLSSLGHETLGAALSAPLRRWVRGRPLALKGTGEPIGRYATPPIAPRATP